MPEGAQGSIKIRICCFSSRLRLLFCKEHRAVLCLATAAEQQLSMPGWKERKAEVNTVELAFSLWAVLLRGILPGKLHRADRHDAPRLCRRAAQDNSNLAQLWCHCSLLHSRYCCVHIVPPLTSSNSRRKDILYMA